MRPTSRTPTAETISWPITARAVSYTHLCLDKETQHYKQQVALKFADLVYNGQWYTPLREALSAFVTETQKTVTGQVKLKLYKGNIIKMCIRDRLLAVGAHAAGHGHLGGEHVEDLGVALNGADGQHVGFGGGGLPGDQRLQGGDDMGGGGDGVNGLMGPCTMARLAEHLDGRCV